MFFYATVRTRVSRGASESGTVQQLPRGRHRLSREQVLASQRGRMLAANQRELKTWPLRAGEVGLGNVTVAVSGPGNFSVKRDWDIQVRASQTPSAVDTVDCRSLMVRP